jgi:hypothetical protein
MRRFVMKPAIAPRTIHAIMPIVAFPPLRRGLGTRDEQPSRFE